MNCVCGHPEHDHVRGGRCRVPDCPCERFRPGETLRQAALPGPGPALDAWAGARGEHDRHGYSVLPGPGAARSAFSCSTLRASA